MNPYEAFPTVTAGSGRTDGKAATAELWPSVLIYRLILAFEHLALSLRARRWSEPDRPS